jgi:hypothetical protein
MDLLDSKTDQDLLRSLLAELAKANNEIKCAKADLDKATSRMKFLILLANTMIDRQKD